MTTNSTPTRGCVFFNFGTAYAVRLLVALYSLRKHYAGPVTVFLVADAHSTALGADLEALGAEVIVLDSLSKSFDRHRLFLESPYQTTLALDCDMIFMGPIDPVWEQIEETGVFLTRFHAPAYGIDGTPHHPGYLSRVGLLLQVRPVVGTELFEKGVRRMIRQHIDINVGVMGISRPAGDTFLADMARHLEIGRPQKVPLLDEMVVVAMAGNYPHHLAAETWNCPADEYFRQTNLADARVIHYFGEGYSFEDVPFGRNPVTWAGRKWLAMFREASEHVPLARWTGFDPGFGQLIPL